MQKKLIGWLKKLNVLIGIFTNVKNKEFYKESRSFTYIVYWLDTKGLSKNKESPLLILLM